MIYRKFCNSICVVALAFLFVSGFVGCAASYSASSISDNLIKSGYTVEEGEKISFSDETDTSQLKGLQKIYLVSKGNNADKEVACILVFDSIANADSGNLSDVNLTYLGDFAKDKCGDSKKDNISMGRYNNVVFAGYNAIKSAAGLN
ncbi:MAG: hypothetical protein IKQ31_00565 [Clostridia bacterium]|nr:hypothetical protein [Clostridia bacterium]